MDNYKIAALVGSLRKESLNMKMAKELISLAPDSMSVEIVNIGDLPLYNEDLEAAVPPQWRRFREELSGFDGVLFVTPEYNRSVRGVLKNAIDSASRPYGDNAWDGKPAAIMGASIGMLGTARAQYHLRQSMVFLNMHPMNGPEVMVPYAQKKVDENGRLTDEETRKRIGGLVKALVVHARKLRKQ